MTTATSTATLSRLNALCPSTPDPGDALAVRPSTEAGCRYEVYASGYSFAVHCRTAAEVRETITDHYRALREQGRL